MSEVFDLEAIVKDGGALVTFESCHIKLIESSKHSNSSLQFNVSSVQEVLQRVKFMQFKVDKKCLKIIQESNEFLEILDFEKRKWVFNQNTEA